jgi:hypothetical protein
MITMMYVLFTMNCVYEAWEIVWCGRQNERRRKEEKWVKSSDWNGINMKYNGNNTYKWCVSVYELCIYVSCDVVLLFSHLFLSICVCMFVCWNVLFLRGSIEGTVAEGMGNTSLHRLFSTFPLILHTQQHTSYYIITWAIYSQHQHNTQHHQPHFLLKLESSVLISDDTIHNTNLYLIT